MQFPIVDLTGEKEKWKSLYKAEVQAHRMTRVKLEVRTWFLRATLAYAVALTVAIIVKLLT